MDLKGIVWKICLNFVSGIGSIDVFLVASFNKEMKQVLSKINQLDASFLLDIINHKWYTETLPNSWNDVNAVWQCQRHCGKCK